jgi:uncharacterized hydrophobic protein (TIGR00271 family)
MTTVAERLDALAGARHVSLTAARAGGAATVSADLRAEAADAALETLRALGVPADDVALVRLDAVASGDARADTSTVIWADVLGQAQTQSRAPARYFVLMAAAGVIAANAVVDNSATLIVGAMAISPDLLPIIATCTGLVLRRSKLAARGLVSLALGLATAGLVAALVTTLLDHLGLLPSGFDIHVFPASQTHVNATTILVAFAAGVAGMLAIETRASAAVGVGISVATIPATAYLGVALGVGQLRTSLSAVAVLAANVGLMLAGGSAALAIQRMRAAARPA